jgi:hypothetical protein
MIHRHLASHSITLGPNPPPPRPGSATALALPVASTMNVIVMGQLPGERGQVIACHAELRPSRLVFPSSSITGSAKTRWMCNPTAASSSR